MNRRPTQLLDVAPFSMAIMAVCIVYFVFLAVRNAQFADESGGHSNGLFGFDGELLRAYGASYREAVWTGGWRNLILPVFMHGGLVHIGFNMWTLYTMGPSAEVHFGSANFGTLWLVTGIGGACCSVVLGGHTSVGASGAIFGLLGAQLAVHLIRQWDWRRALKSSDVKQTLFFIGMLFVLSFFMKAIDHWAHLGGLLFGIAFGCLFEYWRKHQRIGWSLIVLAFGLWLGAVACTRWTVFHPHYHVIQGLRADQEDRIEEAEAHYEEARRWQRVFPSRMAARAAGEALYHASEAQNLPRIDRLHYLYIDLAAELKPDLKDGVE